MTGPEQLSGDSGKFDLEAVKAYGQEIAAAMDAPGTDFDHIHHEILDKLAATIAELEAERMRHHITQNELDYLRQAIKDTAKTVGAIAARRVG